MENNNKDFERWPISDYLMHICETEHSNCKDICAASWLICGIIVDCTCIFPRYACYKCYTCNKTKVVTIEPKI